MKRGFFVPEFSQNVSVNIGEYIDFFRQICYNRNCISFAKITQNDSRRSDRTERLKYEKKHENGGCVMAYWIIVVDDDTANLQMAGHILSRNDMRVTALKSGKALLDYLPAKGVPSLILLDINMPEMDGFETLRRLRQWEKEQGKDETPVIFLTADEGADTEQLGFDAGVSDYIRKPFNPEILLKRINNIVAKEDKINSLKAEATTDKLTGLLNKSAAGLQFTQLCSTAVGCLMMIDLDSFKLVNDIYGHEMGDQVLICFSKLISQHVPAGSKAARIGGDEFTAFCTDMKRESDVAALAELLNIEMQREAKKMMGDDMDIPLGASVGAVFVPTQGRDYESLLKLADKALYSVKQNGKHGYAIYSPEAFLEKDNGIHSIESDLMTLSTIMSERNIPNSALRLDKEMFSSVYQYIMRYIIRNQRKACKVLFNISSGAGTDNARYDELCVEFGEFIKNNLRKSDIMMRNRYNQYFVLLADIHEASVSMVIGNIIRGWREQYGEEITFSYVTEYVGGIHGYSGPVREQKILVVDASKEELKRIGADLSSGGFYVSALTSADALFEYLKHYIPDLILLSVDLPDMNGFDVMRKLRASGGEPADIPIVFMEEHPDPEAQTIGLSLGAIDFILKPISKDLLTNRIGHAIELISLRRNMSTEVEKSTRENKQSMLHILHAFGEVIDSKDCFTLGHSMRVAEYACEIAKRAGYSSQQQNNIYMAALLHDVGKLGVPDAVINKSDLLSDDEMEIVKQHTSMGGSALEKVKGMPHLASSARWHHERFEGGGYPDGLAGKMIPDEARIIAVADAYAAMTSRRRYRNILSQEDVRSEIEKGRGTQFDPAYADIMLEMIDNDKDYAMRED